MSGKLLRELLAADGVARRHGVGLHPALRAAMAAELRFSARSSGPSVQACTSAKDAVPETVALLSATTRDRHSA